MKTLTIEIPDSVDETDVKMQLAIVVVPIYNIGIKIEYSKIFSIFVIY